MVVDNHNLPKAPGIFFYNLYIIYASIIAYEMSVPANIIP